MKQFLRLTFSLLILLCAGCQNNSVVALATETATQPSPTIYPSQTMTPAKTETPTFEITSTPVDTHLEFGNIQPGQYLLAHAYEYEQDQDFLYFISSEGQIVAKLALNLYMDLDPDSGAYFLNANFAASNDGSRFLIMRPSPKSSYLLNLETKQWQALDLQGECLNASWSPDKTIIALECFDTGLNEIHFYDTISSSVDLVTDCEEKKNICGMPEWSYDGRWLAYIRIDARSGPQTANGIYLFDTSCVQKNTCMEIEIGPLQSDSNPVWSLDNKLIFARSEILVSYNPTNHVLEEISTYLPDSRTAFAMRASPDGKYLAILVSKTSGNTIYLYSKKTNHFDVLLEDPNILSIIGWVVIP